MNRIDILTLALLSVPGMGRKAVKKYIDTYGLSEDETDENILKNIIEFSQTNKRIKAPSAEGLEGYIENAKGILSEQEQDGIKAVNMFSEYYPKKFRTIDDGPVIFYAKGNMELLKGQNHIAIIGTREVTPHGAVAGERLGEIMAGKGKVIVSGLAIGCDTCGHTGCLNAGGKTVAIMPCPLDEVLPKNNEKLAQQIVEHEGLLISEYHIGQDVQRGFYVERDRLQSALSEGVVVVETDVVGGTMHTVGFCQKQGKVLACYKHPEKYLGLQQTKGNQKLISEGAAMPLGSESDIEDFLYAAEKIQYSEESAINEEQISMKI